MKPRISMVVVVVLTLLFVLVLTGAGEGLCPEEGPFVPPHMVLVPATDAVIGLCEEDLLELVELGRDVPHMSPSHARWWFGDETPCHVVSLDSFLIDAHEVTNAQFCVFESVSGYVAEGPWRDHLAADRLDHPVVDVTWNDAVAYATWVGKRLPTEAEWELAARGHSDAHFFWWGDTPDPAQAHWRHGGESFFQGLARLVVGRAVDTVAAGSLPPNDIGVYEMLGNVSEWTATAYGPYPGYEGPKYAFTEHGPFREGEVPRTGRVIRGGSWDSPNPVFVRLTHRTPAPVRHHSPQLGFRCAKSVGTARLPQ